MGISRVSTRAVACAVFVALLLTLLPAGTAQAATLSMPVNVNPVHTGFFLGPGQSVVITASGEAGYWQPVELGDTITPDGHPTIKELGSAVAPELPALSLVGRVGDGPYQFIGSGPTRLSGTGELLLVANDQVTAFSDNSGSWQVEYNLDSSTPIAAFQTRIANDQRTVTFDASGSSPLGLLYQWDFDSDGVTDDLTLSSVATHIFPRPGTYRVKLTVSTGEGRKASVAAKVSLTDRYHIEMKAWIPHSTVVDPLVPVTVGMPTPAFSFFGDQVSACLGTASGLLPLVPLSSEFAGNGHVDYGATYNSADDYKVLESVDFTYNGTAIRNMTYTRNTSTTRRTWTVGINGKCVQTGKADAALVPKPAILSPDTIALRVSGRNPLIPKTADIAIAKLGISCRDVANILGSGMTRAEINSIAQSCKDILTFVPLEPAIDGEIAVKILADSQLRITYATDYFPSYGVAVSRNDESLGTSIVNDASCALTSGYEGAGVLLARLNSAVQATGTVELGASQPCDASARAAESVAAYEAIKFGLSPLSIPQLAALVASRMTTP